jgi:carbon storage regulator CsrA
MALVLTRGPGERIVLDLDDGRTITIEVAEVRSAGQVRLAITAPRDIRVTRAEG